MLVKTIIILFLLTILYSLASSFFFLVRDKGAGERTVRRLTWRIGLSLVLFALLWGGYQMGWIHPSSNGPIAIEEDTQPGG